MDKKEMAQRFEDLDVSGVVAVLDKWEMKEFVDFVEEKQIDGKKFLQVTEGIVKLWRPKANAKKFIEFIAKAKLEPDKYLELVNKNERTKLEDTKVDANVEAQYQTVNSKRNKEQTSSLRVEEILKRIVPAKSFLYRNQTTKAGDKPVTSYVPMDAGTPKKKKFFRLSSYEYPQFDEKHHRLSKTEAYNDRGYYTVKTNNRFYIQKTFTKPDSKTKYKSLSATEEIEKFPDDHFYEDLNYIDNDKEDNDIKELKPPHSNVKPCMVKIQELFSSFKLPFFKKSEETEGDSKINDEKSNECESDGHIYENSDSVASMYDSIHVSTQDDANTEKQTNLPVEDYLEPVHIDKEYCDVATRPKDESILSYILNLFESLGMKRETTEDPISDPGFSKTPESPMEDKPRSSMADRPLPVPVENEPYFMDIDRTEAENLLRGQPDGTFILRPSSQPDHAYTLTVSCAGAVHNVGVRRRPDGRLALGFARRAERSFPSVTSLLHHHRKQRLLLVAGGAVCGATALVSSPEYYQTPSELARPVK